ncbi:MAG: DUF4831 family protein [Bacteroidales bacterium]|jgi:hypothetical protein|nr:DUF4831 family protein [Bacteroidales bacterium]
MRKYIFLAAVLSCVMAQGQTYSSFPLDKAGETANGIYYTVPQTELVFEIRLEKNVRHKGIFAQSAYLLGLKNVPTKDDTIYSIQNITIKSQPTAGAMYILETKGVISVEKNSIGALTKIMVSRNDRQSADKEFEKPNHSNHIKQTPKDNAVTLSTSPIYEKRFMELGMLEPTSSLTAEKAVERIKALREEQIKMLSEGVDGTYLNTTIDFMYKQLDEIINGYVAMFAGVEDKQEEVVIIKIVPEKPIITEEDLLIPLCSFSEKEGVKKIPYSASNSTQIDNKTIVANLHCYNTIKPLATTLKRQSGSKETQERINKKGVGVYYAIPEKVEVSVSFGSLNFVKDVSLAQFGVTAYTLSNTQSLDFDRKTGELKSVSSK